MSKQNLKSRLLVIVTLLLYSSISYTQNLNEKLSNFDLSKITKDPYYSDPILPYQWHLTNNGQSGGLKGVDINVRNVWLKSGLDGSGINIGIIDDGIQHIHPDIAPNFSMDLSYDFIDNDNDPAPKIQSSKIGAHGTSIAGLIAATDNDVCGLGAAYNAAISGIRFSLDNNDNTLESIAFSYKKDSIDIYLYGLDNDDNINLDLKSPKSHTLDALEENTSNGRGGLGNIYVWPAGNNGEKKDNVNYDGYANSIYTIAVGAIDHKGKIVSYSEQGSALLTVAPGGNEEAALSTTDLYGRYGVSKGDCRNDFIGTAASASLVSGVIALMLQANHDLSWRDVQHILIKSAVKNDPDDSDWTVNGQGLNINHKYGFGKVDAMAAVNMASSSWVCVTNTSSMPYITKVNKEIPDNNETIISIVNVPEERHFRLEHVEVIFNATHSRRGDIKVVLTSPEGTQSVLADVHDDRYEDYNNWRFMTLRNWDEFSSGNWTLTVSDENQGHKGIFVSWELILHVNGDAGPLAPIARDDEILTSINESVTIDVLANDFDPNGDQLSLIKVTKPAHGNAQISDNKIIYTPDNFFTGEDSFIYTVSDSNGLTDTAKVTVTTSIVKDGGFEAGTPNPFWEEKTSPGKTLIEENDEKAHSGNFYAKLQVGKKIDKTAIISQLFTIPTTENANLTFWLKMETNEVFAGFYVLMDDDFLFTISEADFSQYNKWTPVVISLNAFADGQPHKLQFKATYRNGSGVTDFFVDDVALTLGFQPPSASDDIVSTTVNESILINVLENDFDPNRDDLKISEITSPKNGKAELKNESILYTPNKDFVGNDSFTYTIDDSQDGLDTASVFITVKEKDTIIFNVPETVIEGQGIVTGKLIISHPISDDLIVNLESSNSGQISLEQTTVTIPAGQTSVDIQLNILDNSELDGTQTVILYARALNWETGIASIRIVDDEQKPLLVVSPLSHNVPETEGNVVFNVSNGGDGIMTWTAKTDDLWLSITEGLSGTNDGVIKVHHDENNAGERIGQIIVSSQNSENKQIVLTISQNAFKTPEELKIAYSDEYDHFGHSLAMSDSFLVIGAPIDDMIVDDEEIESGSVYVLKRNGRKWIQDEKIILPEGNDEDAFGRSTGVWGNYLIAGAPGYNDTKGAAWIFEYIDGKWINKILLENSKGQDYDFFGLSCAITENYAIVGAYGENKLTGAAYIYNKKDNNWVFQQKLLASDGKNDDYFGFSVAIYKDIAVIGAYKDNDPELMSGSVYVFMIQDDSWVEKAKLKASDVSEMGYFGYDVDIYQDLIVVGSRKNNDNSPEPGAAYIFRNNNNSWKQESIIKANDSSEFDFFGSSVSIFGNYILVGSVNSNNKAGAAYVFTINMDQWNQIKKLNASQPSLNSKYGASVAIYNDDIAIGAYMENDEAGSVYLYNLNNLPEINNISGKPDLSITNIPQYGNMIKELKGTVNNCNFNQLVIAVYIYKNNRWYNKPDINNPETVIDADGSWICDVTTKQYDNVSTKIGIFLLPKSYKIPLCNGLKELPQELFNKSVLKKIISRNQKIK